MLSFRGQEFAKSGLYGQYGRGMKEPYDKFANPDGEIDFRNAENFQMHRRLIEYLNDHFKFDTSNMKYNEGPIGTTRLRTAMASHLNDYFCPFTPVTIEHVTFTPGVTGLNEMFTFALADEGDGILLGRPIYGSFHTDLITKSKCKLIYATFGEVDQFSIDCIAKYEEALIEAEQRGVKVKALLICNPHNPLGRCYTEETLAALMEFCEKRRIHLVSDEVYALSVFQTEGRKVDKFVSALSVDPRGLIRTDQIHVLYGLSKDFGAAGLRLGCLATQNKEMTKAIRAISRFHWPSEVSGAVAATILEDKKFVASYIQESRERLAKGHSFASKILEEAGIRYVPNGNAGFFLWIDLAPYLSVTSNDEAGWEAERKFKARLSEAGVRMSSGALYREERPGWFRFVFTLNEDALEEGLKRILEVADKPKATN